jgi:subtilisin family serine protease
MLSNAVIQVRFAPQILCILCLVLLAEPGFAGSAWREDQFFVQPKRNVPVAHFDNLHTANGCKVLRRFERLGNLQLLNVPAGKRLSDLLAAYQRSGMVEYAEPDYIRTLAAAPNDPNFVNGTLWALNNYGQNGGTPHADINATNAWDLLTSASNIVVAVLDTGIRATHEDLAANMWVNPNDGSHGTNSYAGTTDSNDDAADGHGTDIAGIIGAMGNNGIGIVGVAWQVQLMACKCFNSGGSASDSTIINAIDFARANGARIMNASFSSTGFSQSLSNAMYAARDAGIVFVAAAGNSSANTDVTPYYPACYGIDNIVSVGYSTKTDTVGQVSNYGSTNVDLFAPGEAIYSTSNASDTSYWPPSFLAPFIVGTSYSAAYVSGAFALVAARFPTDTPQQLISRVLGGVDARPSLAGKCVTGGRLNLRKALSSPIKLSVLSATNNAFALRVSSGPNRTFTVQTSTNLLDWLSVSTNSTSGTGIFDYSEANVPLARVYRAVSTP